MPGATPESTLKTLGFAVGVAFFCALLVSAAVHWLRPIQFAANSIGYTRAILETARLVAAEDALTDREIIDRFLDFEMRVIDLETGRFADLMTPATYDYRTEVNAGRTEHPRYMPAYLLYEEERLTLMVMPFYGPGMWSTIHGLVALEADLATVAGVTIHDHGETPGIGDRIQAPEWLAGWRGKRIYDPDGNYRFQVKALPDPDLAPYTVDAISGATITVSAVDQAMAQWFGSTGYEPVLATLREGQP
jgi:Na+-transporting NADH:ubiquinone oxidoreductase subunit C